MAYRKTQLTFFDQDAPDIQGSYLSPLPDFASHSPFGGPSWFERYSRPENH